MGQNGRDICNTWTLTLEETDKIDVLFEKYEAYCNPKQNVTVIRYKFNTRNQSDGETVDQYVTELKRLAKDCAYGELTSEMFGTESCAEQTTLKLKRNVYKQMRLT